MSLSVAVYLLDENGKRHFVAPPECFEEHAGFESWRTGVWGNEAVRALRTRFFPVLADGDLFVNPDEVQSFVLETKTIRSFLADIAPQGDEHHDRQWYLDTISWRLTNIQLLAAYALGIGGGVVIW
ncbi:hypothetical protein JNUCC0626_31750 [Lentzea sp. JNUCC 0626]|uniref:hypothetical protein n=1 Tax=Lentzea sp. JNUCC 0626 TaxID=3367513 RepID=UPI0037485D73